MTGLGMTCPHCHVDLQPTERQEIVERAANLRDGNVPLRPLSAYP